MPKLTRARTTPPPATASMHVLRSSIGLVARRSIIEQQILHHILWEGRDLRWTLYGRRNMAEEFGCYFDKHPDVMKRSLRRLVNRGWLRRGKDSDGQSYLQLTEEFVQAAVLADQRMKVRRALGGVTWQKINGNDALADALHELALTKTQNRYKARVHAAAAELIANAGKTSSRKDKVPPARGQIVSSKGTLRLLPGGTSSRGNSA